MNDIQMYGGDQPLLRDSRRAKLVSLLDLRDAEGVKRPAAAEPTQRMQPSARHPRVSALAPKAMVAAYEAGTGTVELAAKYGVHRDCVRRQLRAAGVLRPREALNSAQVDDAVTLRQQGLLYREIAARFNVDQETVRRAVLKKVPSLSIRRSC